MAISYDHLAAVTVRAKTGDSQAFTELYELTYQKLYYIAYSILRDKEEAKDAVQEIYIRIFSSLDTLTDERAFVAWSNKIAYHVCLRYLDKLKTLPVPEESFLQEKESEKSDPIFKTLTDERCNLLLKYISELEPQIRATVLFKYFRDLKIQEIAQIMDCPEGTVKSRLNSAKSQLRQKIMKRGSRDILLGSFGFLTLRRALILSAKANPMPPDTAFDTLISALGQNQLSTSIRFIPRKAVFPLSRLVTNISLSAVGVCSAVVVTEAVTASPVITDIRTPEAFISQEASVTAQVDYAGPLKTFYAVMEENGTRFEGTPCSGGRYEVQLPSNGHYTLHAVGLNQKDSSADVTVNCIDRESPVIADYTYSDTEIRLTLQDGLSGIDYNSIYGLKPDGSRLYPVESNPHSSQVVFTLPDSDFKLYLSDNVGNQSGNQITITWH